MSTGFVRSIGPRADVKELEYIAALHQTGSNGTRASGTVSVLDVTRYLRSRFALTVDRGQALDIVRGLGGGGPLPPQVRAALARDRLVRERHRYAALSAVFGGAVTHDDDNNNQATVPVPVEEGGGTMPRKQSQSQKPNGSLLLRGGRRGEDSHQKHVIDLMRSMEEMATSMGADAIHTIRQTYTHDDNVVIVDNENENNNNNNNMDGTKIRGNDPVTSTSTNVGCDNNGNIQRPAVTAAAIRKQRKVVLQAEKELADLNALVQEMQDPKMEYLDIVQLVGILMIPTLARYGKLWHDENKTLYYQSETHRIKERLQSTRASTTTTAAAAAMADDPDSSSPAPAAAVAAVNGDDNTMTAAAAGGDNETSSGGTASATDHADLEDTTSTPVLDDKNKNNDTNNNNATDGNDPSIEAVLMKDWSKLTKKVEKDILGMNVEEESWALDPQPPHLLEFIRHKLCKLAARELTLEDVVLDEDDDDDDNNYGDNGDVSDRGGRASTQSNRVQKRPPKVTYDLIERMFIACGDHERARDRALIQSMVDVATSPSGRFDELAFVNALTSDLKDWVPGVEDRESTYVFDVFGTEGVVTFDRLGGRNGKARQGGSRHPMGDDEELGDATDHAANVPNMEETGLPRHPSSGDLSKVGNGNEDVIGEPQQSSMFRNSATSSSVESRKGRIDKYSIAGNADGSTSFHDETAPSNVVKLQKHRSGKVIDFVIDSFGSSVVLILIWVVFLAQSAAYSTLILSTAPFTVTCEEISLSDESFGCTLAITIINWMMIALLLVTFGMIVLIPLSIGNHPTDRGQFRQFVATIATGLETFIPITIIYLWRRQPVPDPPTAADNAARSDNIIIVVYTGLVAGSLLTVIYFYYFLVVRAKTVDYEFSKRGLLEQLAQSSDERGTAMVKRAGTRKVNNMLRNARRMHGDIRDGGPTPGEGDVSMSKKLDLAAQTDPVFQNYVLYEEDKVPCGTWMWAFSRLLSRELFEVEGIWFPSRIWTFQVMQCVVLVLLIILVPIVISTAIQNADEANDELPEGLPSWVYDMVPTGHQVRVSLVPSAWIALAVCVCIILLYIPSTTSTILKYRCGINKSLGSDSFRMYRVSVDNAYMNTANAVYGMIGGGALFFVLFSLAIFLFIWEFTQKLMLTLLAWGIGLTVTIMLKMILTTFCRKSFYRAFYRIRPGKMNLSSLALECWFLGLGGGVLIGRITQFLLAAAFWIGRIDEPFLAPNVGIWVYKFDYVPLNFVKDLLVHEAHRHPFIERIGAMYLMRLRHKTFGTAAGSSWRQLFVLTLMPWLMKYRVNHEQRCKDSLADHASEREVEFQESMDPGTAIAHGVLETGTGVVDVGAQGVQLVGGVGTGMVGVGQQGVQMMGDVGKAVIYDAPKAVIYDAPKAAMTRTSTVIDGTVPMTRSPPSEEPKGNANLG